MLANYSNRLPRPAMVAVLVLTAALGATAASPPASASEAALDPTSSTGGPLVGIWMDYIVDWRDGRFVGIEMVVSGRDSAGGDAERRLRLPRTFWREGQPHRLFKDSHRSRYWEACYRILHRDGLDRTTSIGCLRRTLSANNQPIPSEGGPVAGLLFEWWFNKRRQKFVIPMTKPLGIPNPVPLPVDSSWNGRRFHLPLPLWAHTPRDARRAIQARGGSVIGPEGPVDAIVLPSWADFCGFDRLSRPKAAAVWLRKGVPVVWESSLDAPLP